MLAKTGIMKMTIATRTTTAKPKTSAGYIIADLTWRLQGVGFLDLEGDAVERFLEPPRFLAGADHRAEEAIEDVRVALHRLLQRAAGLDVGAQAGDRLADRSSWVCSSSVCRVRSIGMPEATRVANWRENTASSRMSTLFQRLKKSSMLIGSPSR